ncbi:M23 family peptidase [Pseudarthrobacter sp. NamE5]|nr:M23 family peptidase [Pseudarthrobacter sp. NamE5]
MGTHAVSGKDAKSPKGFCLPAARAVAATGVLAASVWALNLSGGAPEAGTATASAVRSGAAMGAAGVPARSAAPARANTATGMPGSAEAGLLPLDGLVAGPQTEALLTAAEVEITFPRPMVGGAGEETSPPLSAQLTGLGRPPAGYLMAPLKLLSPSSPFGFRVSPLTGADGDFHLGQDYAAPCGTRVYAADSGLVRAAGWHPWGGGNRVEIDHGNGLITTYNHLESIAVRSGDSVNVGEVIGRVGSTGWSTGCHLHFETILNGRHASPLKWRLIPLIPLGVGEADLRTYVPEPGGPSTGPVRWTIPMGQGSEPPPAPRWLNWPTTSPASTSSPSSSPSALWPADSGTAGPSPTQPSDPGTAGPSPTQPSDPGTAGPSPTQPSDPGTAGPSPTQPSDPGTTGPSPTQPSDPGTATPSPTQPAPSDPAPEPAPSDPAPAPVEPAPSDPAPAPVEPAPSDPAPAPVEPAPSEPAPAPTVAPAPSQPAPAPVEPAPSQPAPAPVEPAPSEPAPAPTVAPAPSQPAPAPTVAPTASAPTEPAPTTSLSATP